ncbi:hypothetical protein MS3_00010546 [Schistosoma haematobium]|uniref:Egg protein CP391S-like protein n=2 Tax=Schistosoma TaxID=6181 RepID=A0A922LJ89_SCHHA|nr:hypothetical protein MS3_00010546 [Schistosoma haematobium]KAH9586800.1 hypothetical protein MS3_00010546 [Schistosoma haematobium]CAH8538392.1 unnamed protein product [Schistosoma haematobium]
MKFTLPSCLLVIVFTKLFDCQNTCGRIKDVKYEKIISQNTSYSYSDHYEYFQRIQLDQPNPIESETFVKSEISSEMVEPKFHFKYYGKSVDGLTMIDSDKLFAVKWSLQKNANSGDVTGQVTYLIYPNGKMSIYFENIPKETDESNLQSWIDYRHHCIDDTTNKSMLESYNRINVPVNLIKHRTLVEFEPNTETCYIKDSQETCLSASKPNMTCYWCSNASTCTNGLDTHINHWLESDCHTTKSSAYLYALIPLVICFLIVCVGFVIWFKLSK